MLQLSLDTLKSTIHVPSASTGTHRTCSSSSNGSGPGSAPARPGNSTDRRGGREPSQSRDVASTY
jgi:hypothetical protein